MSRLFFQGGFKGVLIDASQGCLLTKVRRSYSWRSVALGSILAARREGIQHARKDTAHRKTGTAMKVDVSCAGTP
jgi:hypothetical protein